MASDSPASSSVPRTPAGRSTPVLVPQGALAGRPDIPLDRAVTTVGSSEASRLHLVSRTISNSHALLVNSNGGTYVADLASRTGVVVNGKTVRDIDLNTGDRVQIGKFLFRYRSSDNPAPRAISQPPSAAVIVVGSPAVPITGRVTLIGRRENSEVPLPNDAAVSAAHAVIFQVDDKWVIRDLASRTGTTINDKPVHQQVLKFGDRIQIGSASILFQPARAPVAEPAVDELDLEPDGEQAVERAMEHAADQIGEQAGEQHGTSEPIPVEVEAVAPGVEPEPVRAGQRMEDEFQLPLADEVEPAKPPVPQPVEIPTSSVEAEALALLSETPVIEPVPVLSAAKQETPSHRATTPSKDPVEPASEPRVGEVATPPESLQDAVSVVPVASAPPRSDEPIELEELPPIDFAPGHEPRPPVGIREAVVVAPPAAEAPLATEPEEMPAEHEHEPASAEPSPAAPVSEEPGVNVPTTAITATVNVPPEPVTETEPADDMPDVIFWGDPELDAVAERAILAGPESHAGPTKQPEIARPETAEVETPGAFEVSTETASSTEAATVTGFVTEPPLPPPADAENPDDAPIDDPAEAAQAALPSSTSDAGSESFEPDFSPHVGDSTDVPVDVETVLGDESAVPVDDFSPEGTVTSTTEVAGEINAVVNEFVPGDTESVTEFADEQASVADSTSRELPETDELLTGDGPDAPIEGLEELAAADAPATGSTDLQDLEWIDDASPMESVHGLILGDEGASPVAEATTPVAEAVSPTEGLPGTQDDLDFLEFAAERESTGGTATSDAAEPDPATITSTAVTNHGTGDEPGPSAEAHGFIPTEEPKSPSGPSLFGFDFEGGSFLGGMPLKLTAPAQVAPGAPVARATGGTPDAVFDVNSKARTGLGGMLSPPPARTRPVPRRSSPPVPGSDQPSPRPLTPPRPTINTGRADPARAVAQRLSLTGLGTDARPARPGTPEIPPVPKMDARPGQADSPRPPQSAANARPGTKPVSLDVFSQASATIGVEVFGGRPANPATIKIPDAGETRALAAAERANRPGENGQSTGTSSPDPAPVAAGRRSKIPLLLLMMFVFPIAIFGAVFSFVPSTAKIVGTLKFEGGSGQSSRSFGVEQIKRLRDPSIATTARAMLNIHKIPPGFTEDPITYNKAITDNPQAVTWDAATNTLTLEYGSVEYPGLDFKSPRPGPAQVTAVLNALQSADQDLIDIQARARVARDTAAETRAAAQAAVASLVKERKVQSELAQDTPDQVTVDQLDHEAARLKQQWSDAKTICESSATVLDELNHRDPTKPVDIQHDSQVQDFQHQLDQLDEQIARSRSSAGGPAEPSLAASAGNGVGASTTQPADADPLVSVLQDEADKLSLKLRHRKEELAADAALTPEQRSMNIESAKQSMSVKLAALQRTEADAKDASDHATAAAVAAHKRADNARAAGAKYDDLTQQQITAEQTLKQDVEDERDKQAALDACITVAHGSPINVQAVDSFDPQWPIWGIASALVVMTLCTMIYGEATRPVVAPGATPQAAPLVNPPLRAIPWPQPQQLEGLNDPPQHQPTAEPQQYVGI